MALQIKIKSDNGVLLSYHMIAMISIELNQRVTLLVRSYIDEEGRKYDKNYEAGNIVGEPSFPYTNAEYLSIEWNEALPLLSGDLLTNAYNWLKDQPSYQGAVNV